jgi:hypothetical protein
VVEHGSVALDRGRCPVCGGRGAEVRGALLPAWPFREGSVLPGRIQSDLGQAGGRPAPSGAADRA